MTSTPSISTQASFGSAATPMAAVAGPTVHVRIGFDETHRVGTEQLPDLPEQIYPALEELVVVT